MNVFDLEATIRLNASEFERGIENAKSKAKSFTDSMGSVSKNLSGAWKGTKEVFEPAVKGFQSAEAVGQKAWGGLQKGVAGFAAAATAVGGFGASAVSAGMSFDSTMSKVSAISGATGDDFDALRKKAIEMGATTKFSATEAAEAMTYMGMAGWKTNDMLSGISGIMNLAAASGEDLATTSDIVTDALTAFGMTASDSGHFANVMAVAATNANTDVGMMGETFKYVAPVAGSLGYSIEDSALAIGLMANQSIKASQAGTSLRSIMTRLATNAGASSKSMGALDVLTQVLGVDFYDTAGNARDLNSVLMEARDAWQGLSDEEATYYAKKIAGQEAISGWLAIMRSTTEDVDKLTGALDNASGVFVKTKDGAIIPMSQALAEGKEWIEEYEGAAAAMSATMLDNLQGDITLFQSALEGLKITISDALTPSLREFAQFGSEAMNQLREGFENSGTTGFFSALTGVVTQAVTFLAEKAPMFFEVSGQFIASLAEGFLNSRTSIMTAANDVLIMFREGLNSWLSQNSNDLYAFGNELLRILFQGFLTAGDIISENIGQFIPLIANAFASYHEALFTVGIDILSAIGRGIVENKEQIKEVASDTIANMVTALRDNADEIIDGAVALLDALVGAIIENLPLILEAGAEIVAKLVEGISGSIPAIAVVVGFMTVEILKIVKVVGQIGDAFGGVQTIIKEHGINIKDIIGTIGGAFKTFGSVAVAAVNGLIGGLQALWAAMLANPITAVIAIIGALVAAFVLLWNNCDEFREFWIGLWDKCKEGFGKFADWCREGIENLKEKFAEWRDKISEKFSDLGDWFREKWNTVKESAADAADTAKKKFSDFRENLNEKFGKIHDWFGEKFKAAWEAITSAWGGVKEFFAEKWEQIKKPFSDALNFFKDIGRNIMNGLWSGINEKIEWVKSKAKSAVDGIKSVFTGKSGFDTHSPSRWAKRVFEYVMEGGAKGLQSGSRELLRAAERAANDVKDSLSLGTLSLDAYDDIFLTYLQTARDYFISFLEDCQESAANFLAWARDSLAAFHEWLTGLLAGLSESFAFLQQAFLDIWDKVTETWGTAPEWFAAICEAIRIVFEALTAAVTELFTASVDAIQEAFESFQETFQTVCGELDRIWEESNTFFTQNFEEAAEKIREIWQSVGEFFAELWEEIKSIFEEAPPWFEETFAAALEALKEAFSPVIAYFEDKWDEINAVFDDAQERFAEVGANMIAGMREGVESEQDALFQLMEDIKQALLDIVSSLTEEVQNVVEEAMQRLGETVSSEISDMKSQVEELISKIGEALSKLESAKAKTKALEEKAEAAEKAAEEKAEKASKTVQKAVETVKTVAKNIQNEPLLKFSTNKTPTQLLREEKASYGKTSQATPTQVNRQDKAKTSTKTTNPNGYVSTSALRQTTKTLTPTQINRLDKQLSKGVGFGGGGSSGTDAGRNTSSTANLTPTQIQRMEKTGGNVYVTINSPKTVDEVTAARVWKQTVQKVSLMYIGGKN